jgi:hypothetical protein
MFGRQAITLLEWAARLCKSDGIRNKEAAMAGSSVKNKKKYRALKRKGMSKSRAARIANAGKCGQPQGG